MRDLARPLLVFIASALAWASSEPARAADFSVKYRTATTVYVDAGRAAGLTVGDRLAVVEGKQTIAQLEVVYVAEQSASCKVIEETRPVRPGDRVRVVRRTPEAPAPVESASPPPAPVPAPVAEAPTASGAQPERPWARVRGGASFGYYRVWDESPSALDFEQRTARANLSVWDIGGKPLVLTLRGSSRQDVRARVLSPSLPRDAHDDRLYEASLRYEPPGGRLALELGRVGVSRFVGIGYLDGALGRVRVAGRLHLGGFFGRSADPRGLGLGRAGNKYGGFLYLSPASRYSWAGLEATLALVREFGADEISREYVSLESRFAAGRRFTFFERAEVDLNRGWRRVLQESEYQLSSLSLSADWRISATASAQMSYDNRRNYRTQANRSVAEEYFDRLLRQGLRATLSVSRPYGLGFSANAGLRLNQGGSDTYSAGVGVRHGNLFSTGLSAGLDGAAYTNAYTEGGLVSARLGKRLGGGHLLDVSYGGSFYRLKSEQVSRATGWLRLSGRGQLPRGLYLVGDLEYGFGDDLSGPRVFVEIGWQF